MSFIVYGLPRSRTFWLSRFLSYSDWNCGHDELRHARSMEDITAWFSQPSTGCVETLAAPWWRIVPSGVRTVVVRRHPDNVVASALALGVPFNVEKLTAVIRYLDRKLDQIERRVPNVLSAAFDDLNKEAVCASVFEHCLPYQHDPRWWAMMAPLNLQTNMAATIRYMSAYAPQLGKLAKTAKYLAISRMKGHASPIDGVEIRQEPFDDVFRDCHDLCKDHMRVTGQDIDGYLSKNLPLMRVLDKKGNLQVTTARSNGRLFGYLIAVIGESLDGEGLFEGMHMPFYASPEFPGLGMKLQRASIVALRERGVSDLYLKAGTRGAGPRLGTMYRRLGAEDAGQLYRLNLRDAA